MTRAPLSTAQRIAAASASGEIVPSVRTTFAMSRSAGKATPAIPCALFIAAAISPATNVPCPFVSFSHELGDEALAVRDPAQELRMVRVDAGVEDGDAHARRFGTCGHASKALIRLRYH